MDEFKIEQELRVRIKVHNKKTKKGYCSLSITAALKPKDIKQLNKSKYSLDSKDNLPTKLIYN